MAFLETPRFDENISFSSAGGPMFRTSVVELDSGFEQRNQEWTYPRHEYDVSFGAKRLNLMHDLLEFYWSVGGRLHGFRFKDWFDYKSCAVTDTPANSDQQIGIGDGATQDFQIIKTYQKGALSWVRQIFKPVSGTLLVAVNSVAQTEGVDYTVDYTTGVISFSVAPAGALVISAGYEFDVPVRFMSDELVQSYDSYENLNADLRVVELRLESTV